MKRPETQYTSAGDVTIAYQVVGDGPIDLVHAHGWLGNVEYAWESPEFARLLERFSKSFRLIWFDKRGTGMSDRDVGYATLEERMEDFSAVMDAAGSKRAVRCRALPPIARRLSRCSIRSPRPTHSEFT